MSAAAVAPASGQPTFLPSLTKAFASVDAEDPVKTADFATACQSILPIFDHLGRRSWSLGAARNIWLQD